MQKRILFLLVAAVSLASCSSNYKKTKSGLLYKIFSSGNGPLAKRGQVLKLNFKQTLGDSVLQETYTSMPGYALVDSIGPVYNSAEVFPQLRKGDSLIVVLLGDSIIKKFGPQQGIKKEDKIKLHFKVIDIFTTPEAATADRNGEFSKQKERQAKAFTDYMAKHQEGTQKTASGVYVVVTDPGSGMQAQPGKMIAVKYTGRLIPSEKQFETNMDGKNPPYEFILGTGSVIRGWEEGLTMFKEGGKGKLYIPYELAYGEQPGPGGLPYQPLMFDVEIVSVKDAPQGMPQQGQPYIPERLPADTSRH